MTRSEQKPGHPSRSISDIDAAFAAAMSRAGLTVPADRRAAMVVGAESLAQRVGILRQGLSAEVMPAATFRVIATDD